jgi:glycerophosphoryl diester phosphodiesterase
MLDRSTFLRPIAHRGLHDGPAGVIENTAAAFKAAIARGYGIECDLQPLADGTPVVFHDETLDRLIEGTGRIDRLSRADGARLRYRGRPDTGILAFGEFLELVGGAVPLLVEIKSEWGPPQPGFLEAIAALAIAYRGPLALMSFDPDVLIRMREIAPGVPRGIVAGVYQETGWWREQLGAARADRLTHLLDWAAVQPSFVSYHVKALPSPMTRFVREGLGTPLFCWTVRTPQERALAAAWADAPTFEGYLP